MEKTVYVISYDISKDRIRSKVAKELENYGRRVQYSVFECDINRKQYEELYGKLSKLVQKDESGSIIFYFICEDCRKKITILGIRNSSGKYTDEDVVII